MVLLRAHRWVALVGITLALLATVAPVAAQSGGPTINIGDGAQLSAYKFDPATLEINAGDSVTWANVGSLGHTVTTMDQSFDSGNIDPGGSWSLEFDTLGTFPYICVPHPWMKGTIVVNG
jgi:plastocyanin